MALDINLEVFPAINKIDLPAADPDRVLKEIDDMIGLVDTTHAVYCSAKSGIGIDEILEARERVARRSNARENSSAMFTSPPCGIPVNFVTAWARIVAIFAVKAASSSGSLVSAGTSSGSGVI